MSRHEGELQAQVEELTTAPGEAYVELRVWRKGGALPGFADLEELRLKAGICVERFCLRLGIPRATWYYWRRTQRQGRPARRWPARVVDQLEPVAAAKATAYSAWGHRKIWTLLRADGVSASAASVKRALARQHLLLPARYQAERRALAKARKAVFLDPPTRRNRVWQTDFSEFETIAGGSWELSPVVDYAAKLAFACNVTGTKTARDAVVALEAALAEA